MDEPQAGCLHSDQARVGIKSPILVVHCLPRLAVPHACRVDKPVKRLV